MTSDLTRDLDRMAKTEQECVMLRIQQTASKDSPAAGALKIATRAEWENFITAQVAADPRVDPLAKVIFAGNITGYDEEDDRHWDHMPDFTADSCRYDGYYSHSRYRWKAIVALELLDSLPGPKRRRPAWAKAVSAEPSLNYGAAKEVRDE